MKLNDRIANRERNKSNELAMVIILLNGTIVVLFGMICGFLLWVNIINKRDKKYIHASRVAHTTLIMYGLLMIVIGLAIPYFRLSEQMVCVLVYSTVAGGYGFVFGLVMDALKGYSSITPTPYGMRTVLFAGHLVGVIGSVVSIAIVVYGLFKAL